LRKKTQLFFVVLKHKYGGPAAIDPDGYEAWYQDGFLHRLDGPAVIYLDGIQKWFLNGKQVTQEEVEG